MGSLNLAGFRKVCASMARACVECECGSWVEDHESLALKAAPAESPAEHPNRLAKLFSRLIRPLQPTIPLGYQDETGFHYGTQAHEDRPSA